jgi:uncharacterized protein YyaL (SSP411 family)
MASAAHTLFLLTGERRYERAAREAMRLVALPAVQTPSAFGAALALMARLDSGAEQLVVVTPTGGGVDQEGLVRAARRHPAPLVAFADEDAAAAFAADRFELYADRRTRDGVPTAYLCRDFVCRLPVTTPDALEGAPGT